MYVTSPYLSVIPISLSCDEKCVTYYCTFSQDGRNAKAVDKALELIGEWKVAFGSQSGYKAVNNVFGELEREGYHIPEAEVASAAFIKKVPLFLSL